MSLSLIVTRLVRVTIITVAALSLPAFAAAGGDATAPNTDKQSSRPGAGSGIRRYCILVEVTGTRIVRKVCKTKAEWTREGVDIELEQELK